MTPIIDFIHQLHYDDLPEPVKAATRRCLLDLIGTLAAGRRTRLSAIVRDHAVDVYGGRQSTVLLDGRRCSPPGAALANGMTIDAMDIHDSHRESLGHAGVHVLPALLAAAELRRAEGHAWISGRDFLTAMALGYDLGCRAGEALHATTADYHSSGAWGAVSSAALFARLHGLTAEQTRQALGIAEYHGPRSQMMRVIDHPTMLKDGSGWGAMTGVSAGMLARRGFTGAPALTCESPEVLPRWSDLGRRWAILEQGLKVHATCWWAQPAVEAVLALADQSDFQVADIDGIVVETFHNATRLSHPAPATTEEAQYSVPFPVAAALVLREDAGTPQFGLGPQHVLEASLNDRRIRDLARRVALVDAPDLTRQFPKRFLARVSVTTVDGSRITSADTTFRGEQDAPLGDPEVRRKYRWLAGDTLSGQRVAAIETLVRGIDSTGDIADLVAVLAPPPENR
jgi:2-methylcitrate dehydratase PrpD